jgi:hypothetical protein
MTLPLQRLGLLFLGFLAVYLLRVLYDVAKGRNGFHTHSGGGNSGGAQSRKPRNGARRGSRGFYNPDDGDLTPTQARAEGHTPAPVKP